VGRQTLLVTGGAGFIGCAASGALATSFDRVVVVDSLHPQVHESRSRPAELDGRVELVVGDVTVAECWDRLLGGRGVRPDVVLHLAAETGTGQSLTESNRHALVRREVLPRRIVLTSSRAVYGEGAWRRRDRGGGPGTESFYPGQRSLEMLEKGQWDFPGAEPLPMCATSTASTPVSVYGATKLAQEHVLTSWALSFGVEPVVLRLQNVYGPGQSLINPYTGIMSLFCRMARQGASIPLYEDGQVRRDFVLIDDVARAVMLACTSPAPGPGPIDIGSGEFQTMAMAAAIIAGQFGAPAPRVTGQFRPGDVRHAWADITAAADRLGWVPQSSLEAGLTRLAQWIDAQPDVPTA